MFLNDWEKDGFEQMVTDFTDFTDYGKEPNKDHFDGIEVLLASYEYQDYYGDAFVLYRKDGKLYEVNGSHCSCYGLEGQWSPEETTKESLKHRLESGRLGNNSYGHNTFAKELKQVLDELDEPVNTKYYAIKITFTYKDGREEVRYHTGGGNGAFANVYKEHQVKRILGQYNSGSETVLNKGATYERIRRAEAVEVSFK